MRVVEWSAKKKDEKRGQVGCHMTTRTIDSILTKMLSRRRRELFNAII